jgi:GntR family transcriptional regulator
MNAASYTPESTFGLGSLFASLRLSDAAPEPFWRQLYLQIAGFINSGAIKEGGHLPSERDLAQALGVSRVTVKRCYDELRNAQQLAGKGRAGSVVQAVPKVQPSLGKLKGFTQEMQELGMTELLEREVITDRMMASVFGRPSTAQFLRLVRVRRADDAPMTREVAWYDLTASPSLAQWDALGSAYSFIKDQCGVVLGHAEQTIEAVMSSPAEAQTFSFDQAQPCLLFKRKTYSQQMQLIEYVEGTFRGDAYVYKLKMEA